MKALSIVPPETRFWMLRLRSGNKLKPLQRSVARSSALMRRSLNQGACHESSRNVVAPRALPVATRYGPVSLHLIRGLRHSRAGGAQSRSLGPYPERLFRGLVPGDGINVADTQIRIDG